MTEIKVIELKEDIKNFHKFTPDDLDSFIDRLSLINIDKYHLDNFKFMIQSFINFKDLLNRPNIKELLLRKIILIGQTFSRKKAFSFHSLGPAWLGEFPHGTAGAKGGPEPRFFSKES